MSGMASFDLAKSENEKKPKAPKSTRILWVVAAVVVVGLLSGIIALAVLYSESITENQRLHSASPKPSSPTDQTTTAGPDATLITEPTTSKPPRDLIYRLNKVVEVVHYELDLKVNLPFEESEEPDPKAFTTEGKVSIRFRPNRENVTEIQFHARTSPTLSSGYLIFDSANVTLWYDNTKVDNINVDFQPDVDIVLISTPEPLIYDATSNASYVIRIEFDGKISKEDDNQGLYRSSYLHKGEDGKVVKRWLAATQFQPYKSRRVFPNFDEPSFRAKFDLTIHHDARFSMVRSNAAVDKAEEYTDLATGRKWTSTKFRSTPNMSSYLIAMLIAGDDFSKKTREIEYGTEKREFSTITRKELEAQAEHSLGEGEKMVRYLSGEYFGNQQLYEHLDKIDMAAIPDFNAGAMENWGLVLYREARMLFDSSLNSIDDKFGVSAIVGHELAHFIFGDLITCEFWDDTWLNEGFARFFQYDLVHNAQPQWQIETVFPFVVTRSAFVLDSYETTHPLYDPSTKTLEQIDNMFDTTTYAKGAAVLNMIRTVLGTDNFKKAIASYVKNNRFKNVRHGDLLKEFVAVGGAELEGYLLTWIKQKGYPVLQLKKEGGGITYSQMRFLLPANASSSPAELWSVPFSLKTDTLPESTFESKKCWLLKRTGTIDVECPVYNGASGDTWFLVNPKQTFFYRVDYDKKNWDVLTSELNSGELTTKIDEISRGQLLDDAFWLARSGEWNADYATALRLARYLAVENTYTPFASGMDGIRFIDQRFWADDAGAEALSNYAQSCILKEIYRDNLWRPAISSTDNYKQMMFNQVVIENACYFGIRDCLDYARARLEKWDGFNSSPAVNPTFLNSMLCYGARQDRVQWEKLYKLLTPETSTAQKLVLLRALGCTQHPDQLSKLLELALDRQMVRAQDVSSVIAFALRYRSGVDLTWLFVQVHWDELIRKSSVISSFGSKFNTVKQLNQLEVFRSRLEARGIFPEKISFDKTIAEVKANIAWNEANSEAVKKALAELNCNAVDRSQ